MKDYHIYLAGKFVTTANKLSVISSYDKAVIGTTYLAGKEELEKAIAAGLAAEPIWKHLPSYKKHQWLNEIASKMEVKKGTIATLLAREATKPLKYAMGEVDRAIQTFRVAAEEAKRIPGEYLSLDWTSPGENKEGWIKYFPVGLMAGISPFNFPLNLAVHKIAPALAAGNPIIIKPARSTPLSLLVLAEIMHETGLPEGTISILPMDRESGNQLVTDERFKLLSFTGSPEVGWKMKNNAGKKRVVLELGGNAGVIVSDSADIKTAVKKCVAGGFAYSGQVCIHTQRIFVQASVFDAFCDEFMALTRQLKTGKPDDPETDISAMIDEENAIRVEEWVKEAQQDGAVVLYGGRREGAWVEPTVITQTKPEMKVCAREVFGPVVTIEKYQTYEEAIQWINNTEYGLQAGVFTNRINEMDLAFSEIEAGGVIINDVPTFRVDHMPYGGVKNSGFGREGIKYAIREMMEPKILVKQKT